MIRLVAQTNFTKSSAICSALAYLHKGVDHVKSMVQIDHEHEQTLLYLLGFFDDKDLSEAIAKDNKLPNIASILANYNLIYGIEASNLVSVMMTHRAGIAAISKADSNLTIFSGSLRQWIEYCNNPNKMGMDLEEHAKITLALKQDLINRFPKITEVLGWTQQTT